ncbi:GntR family transcriptional regulator [Mollicutes bacterium LVI A0039]|nr:GntR family transcriptional regulator [Mollicutes bacterium LVI A0039]
MKKKLPVIISQKIINDYLKDGKINASNQLPTQRELQKKYFVSRTTILKAIDILREDNLIYSIQGKGIYFTNDRHSLYLQGIYSYDYQLQQSGIELDNQLLSGRICIASDEVANKFNLNSGDKVIEIIRKKVDKSTGCDVILQCNYLNFERFRNLDFTKLNNNRLYAVLGTDFNLNLTSANEQIMISHIDREYSKFLNTSYGNVMRIDRLSYEGDEVVEFTHTFLLVDSFKYDVKLNMTQPLY